MGFTILIKRGYVDIYTKTIMDAPIEYLWFSSKNAEGKE